ncbi:RluA family pseudouridine synthase [Thermaurantiacus sp.]|uniref:RluA family pseudouridine synthase n=1 Tax=Thermaurantiacus sp. TaxID=2820283 RepID=UPI00298F2C7C|nr:RluA family pseudouridine synthase [Thermaurantiacus sp.]
MLAEGRGWIVVDKPAGLAVHAGPRTEDCVEARFQAAGLDVWPVHRLDRDTSGCLLLATRRRAARRLARAFAERSVEKLYLAIVAGAPPEGEGRVEAPLARRSDPVRGWRIAPDPRGLPAATRWRVLKRRGALALVAFRPETGRTHQVRVHATLLAPGAAILGDATYGRPDPVGLALHAAGLAFPDDGGRGVQVMAPLPQRFSGWLQGETFEFW